MGVLNNQRKVIFTPLSGGETTGASSDEEGPLNRIEEPLPAPQRRPNRPPPSPASNRKAPLAGTCLKLKKGRRARHRYDSERSLFAFAELDPDEAPEGWDIAQENSSNFRALLDDQSLLDQFLTDEKLDEKKDEKLDKNYQQKQIKRDDPESCFLRIRQDLRQTLKKHLPLGILSNVEQTIIEHFLENPQEDFEVGNWNSFERLLAHICCMYNSLNSQSFDEGNQRKIRIINPNKQTFVPIDPNLCLYLTLRNK